MIRAARLGEVADIVAGVGFPKEMQGHEDGEVPVFKVGDISTTWLAGERVLRTSRNYLTADHARRLGKPVPAGSTVFAKIGEALRLNRRAILGQPSLVDNNVMAVVPRTDALAPLYLFYFMQTVDLGKLARATAVPSVRKSDVVDIGIPLPPLAEQERVVAELEKQFSRLDKAVANLNRAWDNLRRFHRSVLAAAIDGSLVGVIPTDAVPISAAIETLDQGWSPQCEREPAVGTDEWAVIKTTAIQQMKYLDVENKRLPSTLQPRPALELKAGDLLLTRAGPRSRVGVACLVRRTRPRLMLCDKAYRIRVKAHIALPAYLEIALNAPAIADELNDMKTGISDSGVNLTQARLGELRIPLPALDVQHQIVAEVERRFSLVGQIGATLEACRVRSEALRESVLAASFS